jgi:hypothetical protein
MKIPTIPLFPNCTNQSRIKVKGQKGKKSNHTDLKEKHHYCIMAGEGACGSIVGWGTMLQAGWVRIRMRWIFFDLPNPSSCTMALGSTQPLREMSTTNLPGGQKAASM